MKRAKSKPWSVPPRFSPCVLAKPNADLDVHLILDNYGTHKTSPIQRWLLKRPRFHVHFTPTSASWLNLVERWFAALTEKQIRWTNSADDILESIARYCRRINDSGH